MNAIKNQLEKMGYDYAVAIATKAEIENGAACGQLAIILVDICGKVFIHDGFINADGYGVIIGEDSDGMIQKSNGIGNWMKEGFCREATSQEVSEFFAKVRKTQKIINY